MRLPAAQRLKVYVCLEGIARGLRTLADQCGGPIQTSKLRVAGSNPAGVANKIRGLAFGLGPLSCRGLSRRFSLRFNNSQSFPAPPRDMAATRNRPSSTASRPAAIKWALNNGGYTYNSNINPPLTRTSTRRAILA